MLFGGETDVNEFGNANEADSSPAEGEHSGAAEGNEAQPSADSLNTEDAQNLPETVPYSRFKEVNEAKKKYEEKAEVYQTYDQMNALLESNPELFQQIQGAFESYFGKEMSKQQAPGQQQMNPMVQQMWNEVQGLKQEKVITSYRDQFSQLAKENGVEMPEEVEMLKLLTEVNMYQRHDRPYEAYDQKNLAESFKVAIGMLKKLEAAKSANYVRRKEGDNLPPDVGGGGSPSMKSEAVEREDRASLIARGLKAGRKG